MAKQLYNLSSVTETIAEASQAAESKCMLGFGQMIVLGVIASGYLALATTLSIAVASGIEPISLQKLVMGAVFPVGLIAVIVAVSELSTGNYLTTALGAMTLRVGWRQTLCNWAGSYAGNFLGAFLLALVVVQAAHVFVGPMWGEPWVELLKKMAVTKASLSPIEAFSRAILCIWLVDLAVWQAYRAKDPTAKFLLIWFPTFAFFALGLEHSVVNMFLFPAGILAGADVSWSRFLVNNLLPVVSGNVVGGAFIVGMLYWYSAGLPVARRMPGGPAGLTYDRGSYRLLGVNLLKGLATAAAFIVLLPGVAAGLSVLLPAELGLLVPASIVVYLMGMAFVLVKFSPGLSLGESTGIRHEAGTLPQTLPGDGARAREASPQLGLQTLRRTSRDF